ncbi:hypothetical protein A2801_02890 [Candidatus Woesebacteria bacterium RIFCSPHIGHO2_01_FULL_41_10]|uniref:Uncharacterized protein n=1 Tax=Candidatus Woesebacteria bacterium RIFCSPHIGHO2_01_FULL_41_10 TaxID=1802500 RepID=A0A1F7YNJ9_9BACT|nr:MAG: hypothetical protein A2801_02890 [Candidatus Woesebacteria bacterium RIFCSPHIGHO2_01_FULL_41_10]
MSNYKDLTIEEREKVMAATAGLRFNKDPDKPIDRRKVNVAFRAATGKELSQEYMRDPSVVTLMSQIEHRPTADYTPPAQVTYDKFGNRIKVELPADRFTANTSAPQQNYSWDKMGNRVYGTTKGSSNSR